MCACVSVLVQLDAEWRRCSSNVSVATLTINPRLAAKRLSTAAATLSVKDASVVASASLLLAQPNGSKAVCGCVC